MAGGSARGGQKAPEPGRYCGTVDGNPAVVVVTGGDTPGVVAWWVPGLGQRDMASGFCPAPSCAAWDVSEGRFIPLWDGRRHMKVVIRRASRAALARAAVEG